MSQAIAAVEPFMLECAQREQRSVTEAMASAQEAAAAAFDAYQKLQHKARMQLGVLEGQIADLRCVNECNNGCNLCPNCREDVNVSIKTKAADFYLWLSKL
jgi:hypothetical protein